MVFLLSGLRWPDAGLNFPLNPAVIPKPPCYSFPLDFGFKRPRVLVSAQLTPVPFSLPVVVEIAPFASPRTHLPH